MKKVYLLAATLVALFSQAQELTATLNGAVNQYTATKPAAVIFNQDMDPGGNGIVSDVLANGNFVACADDFVLQATSTVTKISVSGFQNMGSLPDVSTGLILYIYADSNGSPNGNPSNTAVIPVAKVDIPSTSQAYSLTFNGVSYVYSVNIPLALGKALTLTKGTKYWLVFAPKTNLTTYDGATRFNWFAGTSGGSNAKLIDPSNAFGAGATNYTDISALTGVADLNGLAFTIEGDSVLGTGEVFNSNKITVSPNPTSDFLSFNKDVKSVQIFDVSGRNTANYKIVEGKIDVRNLSKGSYLIKLETAEGAQTTKFIKK